MIQLRRLILPPAGPRTRIAVVGAMVLVLALTVASTTPAVVTPHGVLVLNSKSQVVATFRVAKCSKGKDYFRAKAVSENGWVLQVLIREFAGFKTYPLALAKDADRWVLLFDPPETTRYSNVYVPPYPAPGYGRITFASRGILMGVGFSPTYSKDFSDAVTFTGVLQCKYPKPKPRR